ncbi:putative toxin-antitoxin system toxin component, PIN family [Patescibacteria group bacterium]|nr:putative toxin-antitoxin system toxin component, PIN family [Patescibacteria group bacterium]
MGKERKGLIRAVVDTNVFISATLHEGPASKLLSYWQRGRFIYLISKQILEEYIKVLSYPKFRLTEEEIKWIIWEELLPYVETVKIKIPVSAIKTDPSDNIFLSTAVESKASFIISEDRHLLVLKEYQDVQIVRIRDFFHLIEEGNTSA